MRQETQRSKHAKARNKVRNAQDTRSETRQETKGIRYKAKTRDEDMTE